MHSLSSKKLVPGWLSFQKLLGIVLLLLPLFLQGQDPERKRAMHWFFGFQAGMHFKDGGPKWDSSGVHSHEECTVSMSDTSGELLFYGSNDSLYTRDHQFMPNGDLNNPPNPLQMLAVPKPGSDSLYYVFYSNIVPDKAQYAIVDMSLNGGKGEVVIKDQVILQGAVGNHVTEKVAGVRHCNGEDVWIVLKKQDWAELRVWKLSSNGFSSSPVQSSTIALKERGGGAFRFSPNGEFGAAVYDAQADDCRDTIILYRFDDCSGKFSDPIEIPFWGGAHLCFSPDNSKLYAGTRRLCMAATPGVDEPGRLLQYELDPYQADSVRASETLIDSSSDRHYWDMRIGLDERIYVADLDCTEVASGRKLGVIEHPDRKGQAVSYRRDSFFVTDDFHGFSFPGFLENYFQGKKDSVDDPPVEDSVKGNCKKLQLTPNPVRKKLRLLSGEKCALRELRIYDARGRQVGLWEGDRVELLMDLSGSRAGLYIFHVRLSDGNVLKKRCWSFRALFWFYGPPTVPDPLKGS